MQYKTRHGQTIGKIRQNLKQIINVFRNLYNLFTALV